MAEEIQNQNSFGSNVKSALIFPAAMQGVGAVNAIKRAGSIKGAVDALEIQKFKALNTQLKTTHKDVFSRGTALAENYEKYKGLYKESAKLSKKSAKIAKNGGKIPLKDKFFDLFRAEKTTAEGIEQASKKAAEELKNAKNTIKAGGEIVEASAKTGFKETAKGLAKKELTSKFNLAISALTTFLPAVKENVIPAFKEQGFGAGVKELAKATARTATDFVSYGIGGAIGRTLGTAIGTVICPGAGSAVGAVVGDAVGSMLVGGKICEKVDKVMGVEDKDAQIAQDELLQETQLAQKPSLDLQM